MYREIKGYLIKQQRGKRSLQAVADASGNAFSDVTLRAWEREEWKPSKENLGHLLKALECGYDDISEPVDLITV